MHQIRIFIGKEDEASRLTKEVNDWLASSQAKIVNVFGNLSPQTVTEKSSDSVRTLGDNGGRRYAPSDIMMVVVFEQ